ncbi:MAG TPA: methyl-accepting chemotaxis protein [Bryobacteraceae bacterium]|nr:methyl-accepting chemotaxis protein [Bryobacteraceae bacterium]
MTLELPRLLANRLRAVWEGRTRHATTLTPDGVRELSRSLEEEKQALETFTTSMEEEFLQLGALLRKITVLARDVQNRSGEIMDAAAGRAEDAAIQFAFQLLKKAEDLVRASREQYATVFQLFEKMHVDLTRVARERGALMRTLSPLESTNTQFRIQACAFDENTRAQFFALADAIAAIVRDVQLAVGQRFEELDRTGRATSELVANLTALAAEQTKETERMLAQTRSHLSTLNAALQSSERAAQSIAQAGSNIAGGVGKVIVALQCQDMARQKFQHICAAIDDMLGHLASGVTEKFGGTEEADCRHFLADASRVQLGQLRGVFGQLDEAARQVDTGLSEVDSDVKSLADHAVHSGAAALDGRIIDRAIESIHAVLGVMEKAVSSIKKVLELVVKLKSTFSDCTSQILGLALGLRMVALNAQIFAAHVDTGAALEVVAMNTRMIADESMQQLDEISVRVAELVDSVVDLEQRLGDYAELAEIEQALLADEARESENKLRALEQHLRTALAAMGPMEKELAETIQHAVRSIRFPEAVTEEGSRSTGLFEQIASRYSDSKVISHRKVQELKRNYTMQHERAVHESTVSIESMPAQEVDGEADKSSDPRPQSESESPANSAVLFEESSPLEGGENGERLADNVELF